MRLRNKAIMTHSSQHLCQLHPKNYLEYTLYHQLQHFKWCVESLLRNFTLFAKKYRWISGVNKKCLQSWITRDFVSGLPQVGYMINHGLKRYYQNKFMLAVKKFNRFRACFDESLNHVPNNKQIDVYLFYFDSVENRVVRSYIRSFFYGSWRCSLAIWQLSSCK